MNPSAIEVFEALVREAGEGWLIDWYVPREQAAASLLATLANANDFGRRRLGEDAPELTPMALARGLKENPASVRAFLQALGSVESCSFLVMVARIIGGNTIESMRLEYDATGPFRLSVRLASTFADGTPEEYSSRDISDAAILRHLGTLKMGEQGTFDGFYALNLR